MAREHDRVEAPKPQVADDLPEARPDEVDELTRSAWPDTEEELAERTGRDQAADDAGS
jgi:hypothetical protein